MKRRSTAPARRSFAGRSKPEASRASKDRIQIAVDIGGTFTDIATIDADGMVVSHKLLSTSDDFAAAVIQGIRSILTACDATYQSLAEIRHASTVATNVILEHKGARTALITTAGFRDVLEMRRIRVPVLYDPNYIKPAPLVPRRLRFEVQERIGPRGEVITPLDEASVEEAADRIRQQDVEAVAVCLLHSYANTAHEQRIGEILRAKLPNTFITLSADVLPEIREYERTSTTVINAYVGPAVARYLTSLLKQLASEGMAGRTLIMQSNGGMLAPPAVVDKPAQIVECGPAGGVIGAAFVCRKAGYPNAITLDIGGTTAKTALIEDGRYKTTGDYEVAGGISSTSPMFKGKGYALKFPVIDLAEVGSGGGSIARVDHAGALKVGPDSAGAMPGPACYARGGLVPTLTDANVVLGYLSRKALAGGATPLDAYRANRAIDEHIVRTLKRSRLESAFGVHAVANANMMKAIKSVSTHRGRDPREFVLFAFGGNGGIHAAGLAETLGMRRVVIPPAAGVFSALGMLYAQVELELSRAFVRRLEPKIAQAMIEEFKSLEQAVARGLQYSARKLAFTRSIDIRYRGQAYELTVAVALKGSTREIVARLADSFAGEHERSYGYRLPQGAELEIVAVRVRGAVIDGRSPIVASRTAHDLRAGLAEEATRSVYFGPRYGSCQVKLIAREALRKEGRCGPFIIDEYDSTIVVPPGWRSRADRLGNVLLDFDGSVQ